MASCCDGGNAVGENALAVEKRRKTSDRGAMVTLLSSS